MKSILTEYPAAVTESIAGGVMSVVAAVMLILTVSVSVAPSSSVTVSVIKFDPVLRETVGFTPVVISCELSLHW